MTGGVTGTERRPAWLPRIKPDRQLGWYALAAAIVVFVVGELIQPGFASASGVKTVLVVASFVGLVAAGQTLVVLIGGIDLSVPWMMNSMAVLLATASIGSNARAAWVVPLVLITGALLGAVNGLGVAVLSVPAVVMTLGMNGVLQGLTLGLTGGFTCATCGSAAPPALEAAVNGSVFGIPGQLIILFLVAVLLTVLLSWTSFGRRIYATGTNPRASVLAGVNVTRLTIGLYSLSGLFAALAGILLTAYGGKATLGMGDPYLFQSIAAVVIGGVSILCGRGHYLGALAGSITLTALVSVLLAKDMPDYGRDVVYGVVVLVIALLYGRGEREAT
ncbi:MAG TPA: ABC transporter permease [Pseudonocardia sp.]|uniref:ABC transporter permease n=1 Tax=Pseudonocardia sp. TaxID=60912 RepID=UPI002ED8405F